MKHVSFLIVSFFIVFCSPSFSQVRLDYYSQHTLRELKTTELQRIEIQKLKKEIDTQINNINEESAFSEEDKKARRHQIYENEAKRYFEILTVAQKDISNKLRWSALDVPPMEKRTYKSDHYLQRMDLFHSFPVVSDAVVFLGNSITERGGWHELLPGEKIANRGIGGDNVFGVLARLDDIIASRPQKIFLMIGINDLASRSWPVDFVYEHYVEIVDRLKRETPGTELFIQSVLPINEELVKVVSFKGKSGNIKEFNDKLKRLAYDRKITYIDVYEQLVNTEGQLDIQYTNDGIHLKPNAYKLWVSYLNENNYL